MPTDPLAAAKAEYAALTGELKRLDAQRQHAKRAAGLVGQRHQKRAAHLAAQLRDHRGSPLEEQYLDEVRAAHYARVLEAS